MCSVTAEIFERVERERHESRYNLHVCYKGFSFLAPLPLGSTPSAVQHVKLLVFTVCHHFLFSPSTAAFINDTSNKRHLLRFALTTINRGTSNTVPFTHCNTHTRTHTPRFHDTECLRKAKQTHCKKTSTIQTNSGDLCKSSDASDLHLDPIRDNQQLQCERATGMRSPAPGSRTQPGCRASPKRRWALRLCMATATASKHSRTLISAFADTSMNNNA